MPIRHGNTYRALGWLVAACLCFGTALAQDDKRDEQSPRQNQADTKQTPAQPPAAPAVNTDSPPPHQPKPKSYRNPCSDPKYGNKSDLCQQWRMAKAAEETADWTYGQFLATVVEVVLLAIAIGIASWAGFWARRAAIAGDETVEVTREATQHQLRAYVAQEVIGWIPVTQPGTRTINGYALAIRWKNFGSTPARRCRTQFNTGFFNNGIPKDFDYPDPPTRPDPSTGKVTPTTEKSHMPPSGPITNTVEFTVAEAQVIQRGERKLFAWGWAEYDDIFKRTPRRRTEVCFEAVVSPDGVSFTPNVVGPFNGADEDCHHKPKT